MDHHALSIKEGTGIFPDDVLTCILTRLPNKSLVRSKFVSKGWDNLITSVEFSKALRKQRSTISIPPSYLLILLSSHSCCSVEMDNVEKCNFTIKTSFPHSKGSRIVGSSNGIVCLKNPENNLLFLCNPTTGSRLNLPCLPDNPLPSCSNGLSISSRVKFGFGYDSASLDYKVWSISISLCDLSGGNAFTGMVYSLKSSEWSTISEFPTSIVDIHSDNGVFCNENLHWVGNVNNNQDEVILGFKINGEACHVLPEPDVRSFGWSKSAGMSLGVLRECLCVGYSLRFWVMKVYGMKESWTKLCSIDDIDNIYMHVPFLCGRPLIYSKSGGQVLFEVANCWLLWFDLKTSSIIKCIPSNDFDAEVCVETMSLPRLLITN